jgi:hypothetical protein
MQFRGIWRSICDHQAFFDPLWAMTDEGFAAGQRRVIEPHRGLFAQMLTALSHPCHYGRCVDGPVDQVRPQRLVAFQQSSDMEPLVMRGLRECPGVPERLPGRGKTRCQTNATGIAVPPRTGASTFAPLPGSKTCWDTRIRRRLRRCGRGLAQTFPHVAVLFDAPFDGGGAHRLVGVWREPVPHLLHIFGLLLQGLVDLGLLLAREVWGTSRPRVVV